MKVKHEKKELKEREQPGNNRTSHAKRWAFLRRTPSFLNWFEAPNILKRIKPYIQPGQVIADIGCGWGYYTFLLADMVGEQGKVYCVDLGDRCIQSIQNKAIRKGNANITGQVATAADLDFMNENSVDFVFANGLLCSMEEGRSSAVQEIKRVLKPGGAAYVSLGAKTPFGLVNEDEWHEILSAFDVVQGGAYKDLWAIVRNK